jgi:hypothetical protein
VPALSRRTWVLALGILIGGGFYLLLIDTTSLPELYVLGGVALTCGVGLSLAREEGFVEARFLPWWLARSWRLVYRIPADVVIVCVEALRQAVHPRAARGVFRASAFGAVAEEPEPTGRRAVAETVGSVAPNTIVIGIDPDRGLLLVHQLRRQGGPESLDVTRLG